MVPSSVSYNDTHLIPAGPRPQTRLDETRPDQIKPGQTKTRRGLCRRLTHTHQSTPWLAPQRHWAPGRGRVPSLRPLSVHYTTTSLSTLYLPTGYWGSAYFGARRTTLQGAKIHPLVTPCKGQETVCVGGLCPSDLLGDHCGPVTTQGWSLTQYLAQSAPIPQSQRSKVPADDDGMHPESPHSRHHTDHYLFIVPC
ncbi:hypothetical protein LY76DRAFT_595398 [Colletotrichum caudatum]|nr:hypothetical protein LY76DRAFT_595398 [Colletotrichum caudatum]